MNILVPKSERIRSDRIGFGSDLHTSSTYSDLIILNCVDLIIYDKKVFYLATKEINYNFILHVLAN
jgi:hypothetical protein